MDCSSLQASSTAELIDSLQAIVAELARRLRPTTSCGAGAELRIPESCGFRC